MPSCYTESIANGISFEQFAMRCARGMGALIMMRDEPLDAPIPERFEPSDYNAKALAVAMEAARRFESMTIEEAAKESEADYEQQTQEHSARIERCDSLRARYQSMLDQVHAWKAPSEDHEHFKSFMGSQIVESMSHDCDTSYDVAPVCMSPETWLAKAKSSAWRAVEHHTKAHAEEIERTEKRNAWLAALRDSLKVKEGAR